MFKIPIISISINEGLKKFINKLVSKNKYENKSKLIRDALLRLMSTIDAESSDIEITGIETSYGLLPVTKKIVGNMIIVAPNDIIKKLNKIENKYKEQIVSKNQHFNKNKISIFIVFEGSIQEYQNFVVEVNSIKEIDNFRYLIIK